MRYAVGGGTRRYRSCVGGRPNDSFVVVGRNSSGHGSIQETWMGFLWLAGGVVKIGDGFFERGYRKEVERKGKKCSGLGEVCEEDRNRGWERDGKCRWKLGIL
ncbi:hypothetical protein Csa_013008 [Cucumis sativus]|uniref:Uncharacterized protein n=1 Tax=Cucumis sativus TaxID=3659 RepID=A0A0A0LYN6_CUCSA|nr:hypothetical protein Csa_013008 [Cucumis sativus]